MSEEESLEYATEIPLAATVQTLRNELQIAQSRAVTEDLLFEIEKVELELSVVVGHKTTGEAGIQFYVLKAGGDVERSGGQTHTLKLTLTPRDRAGNRQLISNTADEGPAGRIRTPMSGV